MGSVNDTNCLSCRHCQSIEPEFIDSQYPADPPSGEGFCLLHVLRVTAESMCEDYAPGVHLPPFIA